MSHTQSDESPEEEAVFPFLIDSLNDRGQTRFCKNLLVKLFEPGISPCKAEFPDIKIKRQIIEHYNRINNKHFITQNTYHLMMIIIINQIFLHHILKNITHRVRDNLIHPKI